MYPVYVRGEAWLALHKGAEASHEFEKIIGHPGVVVSDPVGALAQLELGRAFAMAGEKAKADTSYKTFLEVWKNADPDRPQVRQARAERLGLSHANP